MTPTAERMRKYRARKALYRAFQKAQDYGIDLHAALAMWEGKRNNPVTPICVTATLGGAH